MRTKQEIKRLLCRAVNGREVMTATEFSKAWGYKTQAYAKRKYLDGLQSFGGRYLIDDIAERLLKGDTK